MFYVYSLSVIINVQTFYHWFLWSFIPQGTVTRCKLLFNQKRILLTCTGSAPMLSKPQLSPWRATVFRVLAPRSNIRYGVLRGATASYKLFCNFVRKKPLFYMPIGLQLFCTEELNNIEKRESFCHQTRLSSMISKKRWKSEVRNDRWSFQSNLQNSNVSTINHFGKM